ncbi:MAG TPA: type I 3-dehydroquinate dehydratase [Verrucomicrobiae bacterium]|nr:type I 3-dehydroquinate dehydratase [Verrucomicrobiae bacterium]
MTDSAPAGKILRGKRRPDLVEFRIDLFSRGDAPYVLRKILPYYRKAPTLATIRSAREGGGWKKPEKKRLELFEALIPHVDAVDVELSSGALAKKVAAAAHRKNKAVIVSYHDFKRTPPDRELRRLFRRASALGADIVKIAAMARTSEDVRRLARFTVEHSEKNIVTIAMGRQGTVSRILFPALGSLITYAPWGKATAPGQLDFDATRAFLQKWYPGSSGN